MCCRQGLLVHLEGWHRRGGTGKETRSDEGWKIMGPSAQEEV